MSERMSEILSAATASEQLDTGHVRIRQLIEVMPAVIESAEEAEAAAAATIQATLTELPPSEKVVLIRLLTQPSCWPKTVDSPQLDLHV